MFYRKICLAITGCLLAAVSQSPACASIEVKNFSFESFVGAVSTTGVPVTSLANGGFTTNAASGSTPILNPIEHWSQVTSNTGAFSFGIYNPSGTPVPETLDGTYVAYLTNGTRIGQTLSSVLEAGVYKLEVGVGDRVGEGTLAFGGYTIRLMAGSTLLAEDTNQFVPPPNNNWKTSTVTFDTAMLDPLDLDLLLGQTLRIEIGATSSTGQTVFDNVRLNFTAAEPSGVVPEASSLIIWSVLGLVVASSARRRMGKGA